MCGLTVEFFCCSPTCQPTNWLKCQIFKVSAHLDRLSISVLLLYEFFFFMSSKLNQCPKWGTPHFYEIKGNVLCTAELCQCPKWGNLHFYENSFRKYGHRYDCVNALNGATFISTFNQMLAVNQNGIMCQCPKWGNLHFYKEQ